MSSVDVIVPCYRYAHYLTECVQSALAQAGVDVRVLVLDDDSPDNTAEVGADLASSDVRVTFLRHASNKGHIATYNEGIEWATGDYVLLLSADDYLLPGALAGAAALMDRHPEVGFVFGEALELGVDGAFTPITVEPYVNHPGKSHVLRGAEFIDLCARSGTNNIVPTPTAVVRTRLQKQLGGYRPELPHSGDLEMWLRLAAHSSVGIIESKMAVYRRHHSNMSSSYFREHRLADLQQRRAAVEWFHDSCEDVLPDPAEQRHRLLVPLARGAVSYASSAYNRGMAETARRLSLFALEVDPAIKATFPWAVLSLKRFCGPRLSRALSPIVSSVRNATARLLRGGLWP